MKIIHLLACLALFFHTTLFATYYVDDTATGANDGSSWTDAYTNLQDALTAATSTTDDIWVAAGTYYPDLGTGQTNDDRTSTFQLITGVAIYGGFVGSETDVNERDSATNLTSFLVI